MKKVLYTVVCLWLLSSSQPCHAQNHASDHFIPRENILFQDDFSGDEDGSFPGDWNSIDCSPGWICSWQIKQERGRKVVTTISSTTHISPKIDLAKNLADSFTVSCDYLLRLPASSLSITLLPAAHEQACAYFWCCHKYSIDIWQGYDIGTCIGAEKHTDIAKEIGHKYRNTYKGPKFDAKSWHRMGLSYNKRTIQVYIDSIKVLTVPDCGYVPRQILFNGWPEIKLTNVVIANGPPAAPLSALLKGKPIVTHGILFSTGTARLSAARVGYLNELAQLLKDNPKLKLEIQGHTDNTGTDADNQLLSEKRAATVKDALVKKGIADARLGTKGFGAGRPLKAGSREELKAMNRRVEFVPYKI